MNLEISQTLATLKPEANQHFQQLMVRHTYRACQLVKASPAPANAHTTMHASMLKCGDREVKEKPEASLDYIFVVNVLHEVLHPRAGSVEVVA
jgi:hypothetical protein